MTISKELFFSIFSLY